MNDYVRYSSRAFALLFVIFVIRMGNAFISTEQIPDTSSAPFKYVRGALSMKWKG
jgi:hypothetical protein